MFGFGIIPRVRSPITYVEFVSPLQVMVLITGAHKALALYKAVEEGVNHMWTVSAIQQHPRALLICDEDATLELKVKTVKYFKVLKGISTVNLRNKVLGIGFFSFLLCFQLLSFSAFNFIRFDYLGGKTLTTTKHQISILISCWCPFLHQGPVGSS